jgi:hypothetical protein
MRGAPGAARERLRRAPLAAMVTTRLLAVPFELLGARPVLLTLETSNPLPKHDFCRFTRCTAVRGAADLNAAVRVGSLT